MTGTNTEKQRLGMKNQTDTRTAPGRAGEGADYDSDSLFRGRAEITIRHDDSVYRLRITRQGKLILNK